MFSRIDCRADRFYVGEVAYRREAYRGDHAPIVGRDLFEAVQEKLAAQAVERRCRLRGSPAVLTGIGLIGGGRRR
jgi:site-specific DNA recombinase